MRSPSFSVNKNLTWFTILGPAKQKPVQSDKHSSGGEDAETTFGLSHHDAMFKLVPCVQREHKSAFPPLGQTMAVPVRTPSDMAHATCAHAKRSHVMVPIQVGRLPAHGSGFTLAKSTSWSAGIEGEISMRPVAVPTSAAHISICAHYPRGRRANRWTDPRYG